MIVVFVSSEKKDVATAVALLEEHLIHCHVQHDPQGSGDGLVSSKLILTVPEDQVEQAAELLQPFPCETPMPCGVDHVSPSMKKFYRVQAVVLGVLLLWAVIALILTK